MLKIASACLIFSVILLVPVCCSEQRIKLLWTGRAVPGYPLPGWFMSEPLVDFFQVPSRDDIGILGGEDEVRRFIRLYFPRTYEQLETYDFFLMDSVNIWNFEDRQVKWMKEAIASGSGGMNTCSVMSISAHRHIPWSESVLQEAFPNDAPSVCARPAVGFPNTFKRIRVNKDFPEPVLTPFIPLGIERLRGSYTTWIIIPRQGARTMAYFVGNYPATLGEEPPFIIAWDYGKGRTMTTGDIGWWVRLGAAAEPNPYAQDILMNMIFYATRRKVVTDVLLYHEVRTSLLGFHRRLVSLMDLIDFVEGFGADTGGLMERADDIKELGNSARSSYLEQDFDAVERTMDLASKAFAEAESEAIRVKDGALFWIYLVEWLVISGVSMVSGFIIWSLMIKRKLYREVSATRMQ